MGRKRRGSPAGIFVEAVKEDFAQDQCTAEGRITRFQQKLDKKSEEMNRLIIELDEMVFGRSSAGGDHRALLDELEELRRENREKDRELQEARTRLTSDDPVELKAQRDFYLEKMRELEAELATLRAQESNWHRKMTERKD